MYDFSMPPLPIPQALQRLRIEFPIEIRIPTQRGAHAIVVSSHEEALVATRNAMTKFNGQNGYKSNIYFTMNPLLPETMSMPHACTSDQICPVPASTTVSDAMTVRRRYILIDCDPVRITKTASTDEEKAEALNIIKTIYTDLIAFGFPDMYVADSGNGYHLLLPVDLPNDQASLTLVKNFLLALNAKYSTPKAKVDISVSNASRITKLYGTFSVKGTHTADRPHRQSFLMYTPETHTPATVEQIRSLCPAKDAATPVEAPFDLVAFLDAHTIPHRTPRPYNGGLRVVLETCPFNAAHTGSEVAVFVDGKGKPGFKCQHESCNDKHWKQFRQHYEPDWKPAPAPDQLSNAQIVRHVKDYAEERGIIFYDGEFFFLNGYVYNTLKKEDIESEMFKFLDMHFSVGRLATMVKALACHTNTPTANVSKHLLLKDGKVYDLDTAKVRERGTDEKFFNMLNVKYDTKADCPRFLQFLSEIFPRHSEAIPLIQEFIGYSFSQDTNIESALVFKGEGANGKSVLLRVIEHILGTKNCSHIKMSQMKDKFTIAGVRNKLLNISSEVGSRDVALDELLKQLISGERIQAEKKGKDPFEFTPFAKYIFATNNSIATTDRSSGFERRWIYIPFVCDFHKDPTLRKKKDTRLDEKLFLEADGIFLWALTGLARLKARGDFYIPTCLQENTADEINENNPVHEFAREYLFWDADEKFVQNALIHDEYKKFCAMNGYKPLSSAHFFTGLRRVICGDVSKIIKRTKKSRGYAHIWMRPVPYDMNTRSVMTEILKLQTECKKDGASVCDISFDEFSSALVN